MTDDDSPPLAAPDFFLCTSPEMDALERAAADGKHDLNYTDLEQELARVHQTMGASHFVRVAPLSADKDATSESLQHLTAAQDADATLAFLYISRLLAPPAPLPPREYAGGKIDYDDVLNAIGWTPRNSAHRREMHARLHEFIIFGERACVVGTRPGKYIDKHTGQEISHHYLVSHLAHHQSRATQTGFRFIPIWKHPLAWNW